MKCCRYCEDRFVGCHSTCKRHAEEKAEHEEAKAKERQWKQKEAMCNDYAIRQKNLRRRKK